MRLPPVPANLERAASWAWRLLVVAAFAALVLVVLWYLRVIVLPMIIALTISPALTPVANLLRGWGVGRPAAALSLVVGLAVVAGLIAVVTVSVVAQYDELAEAVSDAVAELTGWLEREPLNLSLEQTGDLDSALRESWRSASGYLSTGVRAGLGLITGFVLAVALLYFVLRDGPLLWSWVLHRFSPELRPAAERAGERAWDVLGGFVRGTALIAAIDAVLIGIGLWLLGVPVAFALAVLIFLGAFVPFVGATISGLIAVLVAFAGGGWQTAVIALGIVIGVQFLEGNFLQPIIQSRTVDLHPALILLAVAAGGSLWGIVGAYLAVPITAVVFAVVTAVQRERERERAAAAAGSGGP
jgi:predicted PurR-regulated permease PerM